MKYAFNGFAIIGIDSTSEGNGDGRELMVASDALGDPRADIKGAVNGGFGQQQSELVAAITRGRVYGTAMQAEDSGDAAERLAADKMAVSVIDDFEVVEIEEQQRERPAGASRADRFRAKGLHQAAIVGQTGERIGAGLAL